MIQIKLLVDNIDLTARSISGLHCCLKQGCFSLIYLFQVFLCLINKNFLNEKTNTITWIITLDKLSYSSPRKTEKGKLFIGQSYFSRTTIDGIAESILFY